MEFILNIFNLLIVYPITNLLVAIYQLLVALHIPSPLGFSIIGLTIAIRFILAPLTASQMKASKKMQDIAPKLKTLKEKYKGNPQRLQAETMLLYKENGINPAAGCLPVLVQLPVIWGLYSVLQHLVKQTNLAEINNIVYLEALKLDRLWDTHFFGLPLSQTPGQLLGVVGPLVLLLPFLTGFSQLLQSKMMFSSAKKTEVVEKSKKGKKKNDEPEAPDFATAFQTQSTYIFPIMIGFFSYSFPTGLSLYWITFTVFGIIQQYKMQGLGGLAPWVDALKGKIGK